MTTNLDQYNSATKVLVADNVNGAFHIGLNFIRCNGEALETRNGTAYVLPHALITHYKHPQHRLLFNEKRDANPFFHLFESLWMLAGRNDVEFVAYYAANMASFSDDGKTLNGAYGYRWRHQYGVDQLEELVSILKADPGSRRAILQMWGTEDDLLPGGRGCKDVCCNMLVKYRVLHGKLNAYVLCRSNDMVFGGYGANAFHFSFLQEYLADRLDLEVGFYEQVSLDAHMYTEGLYGKKLWVNLQSTLDGTSEEVMRNPYSDAKGDPVMFSLSPLSLNVSLVHLGKLKVRLGPTVLRNPKAETFDSELKQLLDNQWTVPSENFASPYLRLVVSPLMHAHRMHKTGNTQQAIDRIRRAHHDLQQALFGMGVSELSLDIFQACSEWLARRLTY